MTHIELNSIFNTLFEALLNYDNVTTVDGYKVIYDGSEVLTVNGIDAELLNPDFVEVLAEELPESALMKEIKSGGRVELELENGLYKVRFEDGKLEGINGLQLRSFSDDFVLAIYDKLEAEYGI